MLLTVGAVAAAQHLDIGGDMMRARRRERRDLLGIQQAKNARTATSWRAVFGLPDVGGEEVENAGGALSPASAISRGTSIADAAARRTIAVGTMIERSGRLARSFSSGPTAESAVASASTNSSNLIPCCPPCFYFLFLAPAP